LDWEDRRRYSVFNEFSKKIKGEAVRYSSLSLLAQLNCTVTLMTAIFESNALG